MSQIFVGIHPGLTNELGWVCEQLVSKGHHVVRGPQPAPGVKQVFPAETYPQLFSNTDVMVMTSHSICSREIMLAAPRLRAVITPTIGVETVDLEAAEELGIIVGYGAIPENFISVAEACVALFAALFYEIKRSVTLMRDNVQRPWERRARMVRGKTIGLIGFGRIGRAVYDRLQGWGVNIQTYDPYVKPSDLPPGVNAVDMATLLATSDLVSVHVTLTKETRHLLGEKELRSMKAGSCLVNTARGGVIDEDAFCRVWKDGHLGGAALDVFDTEPLPMSSPLRSLEGNIILTEHFISHTRETHAVLPHALLRNIENVLKGEPPLYTKNPNVVPRWRERLSRLAAGASA